MALLTSYVYKNVDLNDGTNYLVPLLDTSFDDCNSSDATWSTSKGTTPVQTGITLKEGQFTLPIHIVATTPEDFYDKFIILKTVFNTEDPQLYTFTRKK